jgi:hypothetical protein
MDIAELEAQSMDMLNRPTFAVLEAGHKLRDMQTGHTYRVTFVDASVPTVRVATPDGTRELTASEFLRMEYAQ